MEVLSRTFRDRMGLKRELNGDMFSEYDRVRYLRVFHGTVNTYPKTPDHAR